jgi:hypothetical protein
VHSSQRIMYFYPLSIERESAHFASFVELCKVSCEIDEVYSGQKIK